VKPAIAARVALVLAVGAVLLPGPAASQAPPRLDVFRGMGAWIDIYDYRQWADPEGTVRALSSRGVQTLYLESTSYRRKGPIRYPERTVRFLDAAHSAGIEVVAWYVPGFADLDRDLDWALSAVNFQTAAGNRFDAFGLDIEVTVVADPVKRARRVVELSEAIRSAVGPAYPLAAICVSPMRSPGYWPVFPDRDIAANFDVYMPMSYWTFRVSGERAVRGFIAETVRRVRDRTGRPDMPIHVIGGETRDTTAAEMRGFVAAIRQAGLLGGSIYDVAGAGPEDWAAMQGLRFTPPEPAPEPRGPARLRFGVDLEAYGRLHGEDRRRKVVFETGPLRGGWEIDYEAFDLNDGEVALVVNGEWVADLAPTESRAWSERRTIGVEARLLREDRPNVFEFVPTAGLLARGAWGIRRASLVAEPLALSNGRPQGLVAEAEGGRSDRVTYGFNASGGALAVRVRGYDLVDDEARVYLNGRLVGVLAPTPEEDWGGAQTILLQDVRMGPNRLTFDSLPTPYRDDPWGVRVVSAGRALLA
jgi:hypothetical protein